MKTTHYRPVSALVNLRNLGHNFKVVKKLIAPGTKVLAPVKAHGYGHGLIAVSMALEALGVDYLGVASIDEGIVLRRAGIEKPILVLGSIFPKDSEHILKYRLTQSVFTKEVAAGLNAQAKKNNRLAAVHIKVDTGMHRLGVHYNEAEDFIKYVSGLSNIKIEGIWTHFPCADGNKDFTDKQIGEFSCLIKRLESSGINIPLRHAANSLGVIDYSAGHFNLVRPGLMLYGIYPSRQLAKARSLKKCALGKFLDEDRFRELKPVLSLKTKILHLQTVPAGSGVSYGHSYVTQKKSRIATISIGYGDGYPRSLSNKAYCLISGKRAKIAGTICMDQAMVDVTQIKDAAVGREVTLIGEDKGEKVTVEELAELAGTIPYEIVCGLGTRVHWTYKY